MSKGRPQAGLIALTTGLTESGLRVLTNPNDPAGDTSANDGGGNHDSLGTLQQRPTRCTAAQRMERDANLWLYRLRCLPNWQAAPP